MRPLEREIGERASTHSLSTCRPQSYYIICLLSKREQLRCWRYTYYSTKCFCWFAPAGSRWIYYSLTRGNMWTDGDDRKLLFSPLFSLSLSLLSNGDSPRIEYINVRNEKRSGGRGIWNKYLSSFVNIAILEDSFLVFDFIRRRCHSLFYLIRCTDCRRHQENPRRYANASQRQWWWGAPAFLFVYSLRSRSWSSTVFRCSKFAFNDTRGGRQVQENSLDAVRI